MHNQLQKAINLAKKTGDRVIVVDSAKPEEVFVVMSLDEYEKLVIGKSEVRNLTEDELLDKINRDIAIWKSENETVDIQQDKYSDEDKVDFDDDMYYYDEPNLGGLVENRENFKEAKDENERNLWRIPTEIKKGAEEIIEDTDF